MTSATVRTDSLRAGPLREEHAEDAARLSADASWNQTADDWRLMIRHGHGWGRFTQIGQLVATTLLLPYDQRIAWLGMVLVAERHRHQGVASALLSQALQRCDELGLAAGLDASPMAGGCTGRTALRTCTGCSASSAPGRATARSRSAACRCASSPASTPSG